MVQGATTNNKYLVFYRVAKKAQLHMHLQTLINTFDYYTCRAGSTENNSKIECQNFGIG